MSEKRFKVIDDDFSKWIVDTTLKEDKHEGAIYTAYDMCHKLNELYEENEQLRHEIEIEKKWQLEKDKYYFKIKEENEQLKQEHKIAIDEMLTDYKKLEEENEQLRKKLEQIYSFKGLNCRCVNGV